ncbi:hypothetical protein [Zobellia laminariae]|nr:hypothetical protein [Zobellia laminariae]WKX75516.1 hypothetical protein Q5W13_17985 [Zobellia laminariae]
MAAHYGLNDKGYSIQASFLDYDKNGLLDLYVINQPPGMVIDKAVKRDE